MGPSHVIVTNYVSRKWLAFCYINGIISQFHGISKGSIMKLIRKLLRNERGATAIEYGLIAALIAVAAISAMQGLGSQLKSTFNKTSQSMKV